MSIRMLSPTQPRQQPEDGSSDSSSSDIDDDKWDDWISDSNAEQECKALFDDKHFPSVQAAATHDKEIHQFVLNDVCTALYFHGRVRLINYIRKNNVTPAEVMALNGSEPWFTTDEYLVPVLDNDPLIQLPSDDWTDSEDGDLSAKKGDAKIKILEKKLASVQQNFADYRAMVTEKLGLAHNLDGNDDDTRASGKPERDDDTHYFESYEENDIHAVMIQDKARTATYANFILTTPDLFRDAIVLDVGCGTGILSLFAARAGAQRVIAVDASQIAKAAEKIVKANGLENVITVIKGKVEEVSLPDGIDKVDIIISEWMGYALLYESMLDSVLVARDRFLRPGGVMAPIQCRLMLGLCDAAEVRKERIDFWEDVYGFDLSAMTENLYEEAIIDVVGPETLLCKPFIVKDIIISDISPEDLDFSTSFTLTSTTGRRTKVSAFLLYFDTFFTTTGRPIPPSTQVNIIKETGVTLAELWPVGGKSAQQRRQSIGKEKERITSFSTSPMSTPTHWKQTLFMLREPFMVSEGSVINGTFSCKKSGINTRELDIEIHYSIQQNAESQPGDTIVQIFRVR